MRTKKSLLDRIPLTKTIGEDLLDIRKKLAEDLSTDQVRTVFKNPTDLGMKQSGDRITPDEVASSDDYIILGHIDDLVIRKNKKNNQISVVAADPRAISVDSEEDARRIDTLSKIVQGSGEAEKAAANPSHMDQQQATAQQNTQRQRQEQRSGVFENMLLDIDLFDGTDKKPAKEGEYETETHDIDDLETSKEVVDKEKDPDSKQIKLADDDLMSDPMDTVKDFPDTWTPEYEYNPDEMLAQIRSAQIRSKGPAVQAVLDPSGLGPMPKPSNQPAASLKESEIKEPLPDDYAFDMGDNMLSIKLSIKANQ